MTSDVYEDIKPKKIKPVTMEDGTEMVRLTLTRTPLAAPRPPRPGRSTSVGTLALGECWLGEHPHLTSPPPPSAYRSSSTFPTRYSRVPASPSSVAAWRAPCSSTATPLSHSCAPLPPSGAAAAVPHESGSGGGRPAVAQPSWPHHGWLACGL